MMDYRNELVQKIEKCKREFHEMKQGIIREVERMSPQDALNYGASATSGVEMLTAVASEWKALSEQLRMYDFINGGGGND